MPEQHKTGPERCQAARGRAGCRRSRWRARICTEPRHVAAFCRRAVLIALLFASIIAPPALASRADKGSDSLRTADHVHAIARRADDAILVTLRIDPGYHVNANPASNDYLIPTSIAFEGVAPERIGYPPAIPFKPAFSDEPINVYEGTVVIVAIFPPGALDRVRDFGFTLTAQACTTAICLPPADINGRATW